MDHIFQGHIIISSANSPLRLQFIRYRLNFSSNAFIRILRDLFTIFRNRDFCNRLILFFIERNFDCLDFFIQSSLSSDS